MLAIPLLHDVGNVVVHTSGRKRVADRKKRIHPVSGLVDLGEAREHCYDVEGSRTYLVVLITPCVVLPHSEDEVQNGDECPDGIRISPEHDVAEADVVVRRDMASRHSSERSLSTDESVVLRAVFPGVPNTF